MKIYPVAGHEGLRDPVTRRKIPAEGLEVPETPFWLRRLAHGDVTDEAPARAEADSLPELAADDQPSEEPPAGQA
jgi:hypothetical protein